MGLDANEDICTLDIIEFFHKFGMSKSIVAAHRHAAPPTQNHGSYPIHGIFTTQAIRNHTCGYLSGLDAIGDHRCLWINFLETGLFGNNALEIISP